VLETLTDPHLGVRDSPPDRGLVVHCSFEGPQRLTIPADGAFGDGFEVLPLLNEPLREIWLCWCLRFSDSRSRSQSHSRINCIVHVSFKTGGLLEVAGRCRMTRDENQLMYLQIYRGVLVGAAGLEPATLSLEG
jgi:hypothetical protein